MTRPALDVAREFCVSTPAGVNSLTDGRSWYASHDFEQSLAALIESQRAEAYQEGFEAAREMAAQWAYDHIGVATINATPSFIYDGIRALRPPAEAKEW